MPAAILLIGLLLGDTARPIPELSGASFASVEECQDVASNPAVYGSYRDELGPGVVLWCAEVGREVRLSNVREVDVE